MMLGRENKWKVGLKTIMSYTKSILGCPKAVLVCLLWLTNVEDRSPFSVVMHDVEMIGLLCRDVISYDQCFFGMTMSCGAFAIGIF